LKPDNKNQPSKVSFEFFGNRQTDQRETKRRPRTGIKINRQILQYLRGTCSHMPIFLADASTEYKSALSLSHYMSDIFGHWHGHNIHSLRPGQDCKTLWDYLESLSPAPHMSSGRQGHHLKLAAIRGQKWDNGSKSNTYKLVCFPRQYRCQISEVLKVIGQHIRMPPDRTSLHNNFLKSFE